MSSADNKVIHLHEHDAAGALERLNRITGLSFARWPQSLAPVPPQQEPLIAAEKGAEPAPRNAETG